MAPSTASAPARTLLVASVVTAGGLAALALPAQAQTQAPRPASFTSTYTVQATAQEVAGGVSGDSTASAAFVLEVNSEVDVLCYSITTRGVEPPYMSPARTSTHLHEAPAGQGGPPRIVFEDPASETEQAPRTSEGCLQAPFTTGVQADGADTGAGFTLAELEAAPGDYYVDIHTENFPGGSLRGQLVPSSSAAAAAPPAAAPAPPAAAPAPAAPPAAAPPAAAPPSSDAAPVGGVAAGFGGLQSSPSALPATAALAAALLVLAGGATGSLWLRRRSS